MNFSSGNSVSGEMPMSNSFEDTLRLLAHVSVPEGLEDRVQAGLKAAPRSSRMFSWPVVLSFNGDWMRAAAAAAIVFVVAGGGWGIYSRVQPGEPARGRAMAPHVGVSGGFSNAGAMRTPQTLNGPTVAQPAIAATPKVNPAAKVIAQAAHKTIHQTIHHGKSAPANKVATDSAVSQVK